MELQTDNGKSEESEADVPRRGRAKIQQNFMGDLVRRSCPPEAGPPSAANRRTGQPLAEKLIIGRGRIEA